MATRCPSANSMMPARSSAEACSKISFPLIRSNKAEALIGVVPLHRAQLFDGGAVARRICRSLRPRTARRILRRGAGIHADDLGHLRPLRSWAGAHLKRRARRYATVAAALSHAYMQEGIAGPIRELHEA